MHDTTCASNAPKQTSNQEGPHIPSSTDEMLSVTNKTSAKNSRRPCLLSTQLCPSTPHANHRLLSAKLPPAACSVLEQFEPAPARGVVGPKQASSHLVKSLLGRRNVDPRNDTWRVTCEDGYCHDNISLIFATSSLCILTLPLIASSSSGTFLQL
jgi:hypothetical protein